jgi:hypothetical protein
MPEKEDVTPQEPIYNDAEVGQIMYTLQTIYALDDAVANGVQLRRPDGFVRPLAELRNTYSADLTRLTSKGKKPEPEKK